MNDGDVALCARVEHGEVAHVERPYTKNTIMSISMSIIIGLYELSRAAAAANT